MFGSLFLFVFPFAMAFAAASDVLTMKIPNWLSVAVAASFLAAGPLAGLGWQDLLMHAAAGAVMLIAGFALFALRVLGGGDAKLLAAASVWIGFAPLVTFLAYVAIFGGVLAVAVLAYRSVPAGALPLPDWALRLHVKGNGIPYGVAIAVGALTVYPATPIFTSLSA